MNHLAECLEDFRTLKLRPEEFRAQVCPKCRNGKCELSRWTGDPFTDRIAHQPDRFFNPQQADPHSSRYAHLVDFGNLLHRAMQLEVADRRKDWVVPEISVLDGKVEAASAASPQATQQVEQAVQALQVEEPPAEDDEPWPEEPESLPPPPPPPPPPEPPVVRPKKVPARLPRGNIPVPDGGLMVGGGPAPKASPVPDPWAPPALVSGPKKVVPGARIRFGLTGEIDEGS